MIRRHILAVAFLALAACGGPSTFMTPQSAAATKAAVDACAARVTSGQPLSRLERQGFSQSGNRYVSRLENPNMIVGGSIISARMGRGPTCIVSSEPVGWDEIPTIQRMVREAVARTGGSGDASVDFNPGGGLVRITFRQR